MNWGVLHFETHSHIPYNCNLYLPSNTRNHHGSSKFLIWSHHRIPSWKPSQAIKRPSSPPSPSRCCTYIFSWGSLRWLRKKCQNFMATKWQRLLVGGCNRHDRSSKHLSCHLQPVRAWPCDLGNSVKSQSDSHGAHEATLQAELQKLRMSALATGTLANAWLDWCLMSGMVINQMSPPKRWEDGKISLMIETRSTKKIESINHFIVCVSPYQCHCWPLLRLLHNWKPSCSDPDTYKASLAHFDSVGTECFWAHLEQSNCRTALRASPTCRAPHTGPLPPVLQAFHMSNCSAGQLATLVASNTLRAKEARLLSNVCNSWGSFGCRRWEYQPQAMLLLLAWDLL